MLPRTSNTRRRTGGAGGPHRQRSPATDRPRTPDHWCSRASLIARGDERDCDLCRCPADLVTPGGVALARQAARSRTGLVRGAAARHMGRFDLKGNEWGAPNEPRRDRVRR